MRNIYLKNYSKTENNQRKELITNNKIESDSTKESKDYKSTLSLQNIKL